MPIATASASSPPSAACDGPLIPPRRLFRLAAIGGELVAVEVADVAGIGVRPEAARPDRALVLAAGGERRLMERRHRGAVRRLEADRAAVGGAGRLAVGRGQHHEFLARLPPARAAVAEVLDPLQSERRQHRVVEGARLGQIVGADRDMGEYRHRCLRWPLAATGAAAAILFLPEGIAEGTVDGPPSTPENRDRGAGTGRRRRRDRDASGGTGQRVSATAPAGFWR